MFSSLCLCLFIHSHFLLRVPCLLRLVLPDLPPRVPNRWKLAQCNGRVPELLGTQWGLGPGHAPSGRVTSGLENEGRGQAGPTGPLEHSALQPRGPISPPAVPTMAVGSGRSPTSPSVPGGNGPLPQELEESVPGTRAQEVVASRMICSCGRPPQAPSLSVHRGKAGPEIAPSSCAGGKLSPAQHPACAPGCRSQLRRGVWAPTRSPSAQSTWPSATVTKAAWLWRELTRVHRASVGHDRESESMLLFPLGL